MFCARERNEFLGVHQDPCSFRHFPPPWTVEDVGADVQRAAFVVSDANGQKLAYVYFKEEPGPRSSELLTTAGARSSELITLALPIIRGTNSDLAR